MPISEIALWKKKVDAEWKIIYSKLDKIANSGAKIVLSKLPIGDLATQYFADRDIFCSGRVPNDDLTRVCKATGARVQTSLNDVSDDILGNCEKFEEVQVRPFPSPSPSPSSSPSPSPSTMILNTYPVCVCVCVIGGWRALQPVHRLS